MKREILQFTNLRIKNEYGEQLEDLNMIFLEGEAHLLWGWDSTPRIFASLFCGKTEIVKGNIYINSKITGKDARYNFEKNGIYFVDSQIELMKSLNLSEQLFLLKNNSLRKIRLNSRAIEIRTREIMNHYNLELNALAKTSSLRAIEKVWFQLVRLADRNARMIVLGGVTEICSQDDLQKLLRLLEQLKNEGISFVIYDSHPEYFLGLADNCYLMKNGKIIKKFYDKIRFEQYWKTTVELHSKKKTESVQQRKNRNYVSFKWQGQKEKMACLNIFEGETVYVKTSCWEQQKKIKDAFLGVYGQGTFLESRDKSIFYNDKRILAKNRIGFWGNEVIKEECFLNLSVRDNILLPSVKKISRCGFYQAREKFVFQDKEFCPELHTLEQDESMSDEKIFKILFYRWKLFNPQILILYNVFSRANLEMRQWLWEMLFDMTKRGTGLILLEAFEEDMLPFVDRVVIPGEEWV